MEIRDRVVALRRVRASDLRPHPKNWRRHPEGQRAALAAAFEELGFAGAVLARECKDGTLELIDGHLRAEISHDAEIPVLVLDLTREDAEKLLATYDPLSAMAEADQAMLDELVASIETESAELKDVLDRLQSHDEPPPEIETPEPNLEALYQLLIDCDDELAQRELYERLTAEGLKCKVITL